MAEDDGLFILSLTLHGLVRSEKIELGRDADTGGQVSYVVDQARALVENPDVGKVQVMTRLIEDKNVDDDYARTREDTAPGAEIVRIPFGPRRYLRKERLWPYLDGLVDRLLHHVRAERRTPDIIHAHYADAGYVGAQLAGLLDRPMVFTGHSLGRVKRARLLEKGATEEELERRYNMSTRIEAEETALMSASLVVTSTRQEVREQYAVYDNYVPERMEVIPPGVDLTRFSPPDGSEEDSWMARELSRFLRNPQMPLILAVARPDERKNFPSLIEAFAETEGLRERANLVLVAGNRDDVADLSRGARRVIQEIFRLVDRHDLYGSVAYPKHHRPRDVPDLYRLAAKRQGVFVNVALTEPFGLTLIEAAASGLPVVATSDGGPKDILETCKNGVLVEPTDTGAVGRALLTAVTDKAQWETWSRNATRGVKEYSWTRHVDRYLEELHRIRTGRRSRPAPASGGPTRLTTMDRVLMADVDDTLTGDDEALAALRARLRETPDAIGFGIATGRDTASAQEVLRSLDLPDPDILISSVGTEICYGPGLAIDRSWTRHVEYQWNRRGVEETLAGVRGLSLQPSSHQQRFKVSYVVDTDSGLTPDQVLRRLRKHRLRARVFFSHGMFLDVLPLRASPGLAIRFLSYKWNLAPDRFLVCGDSGNDEDMLSGDTLGVVVGNFSPELAHLRGYPRVFFAEGRHAWGVLEGIDHYNFFDEIRIPGEGPDEAVSG